MSKWFDEYLKERERIMRQIFGMDEKQAEQKIKISPEEKEGALEGCDYCGGWHQQGVLTICLIEVGADRLRGSRKKPPKTMPWRRLPDLPQLEAKGETENGKD